MDKTIFRRLVLDDIERYLQTDDIIALHGARQVGKTSLLMYLQRELTGRGAHTQQDDLGGDILRFELCDRRHCDQWRTMLL